MKIQYVADDGMLFTFAEDCLAYEASLGLKPTHYAKALIKKDLDYIVAAARDYAKWLRKKQNYPATDSGEHHCCDLLVEMARRLEGL